jgi:hypothetical protein
MLRACRRPGSECSPWSPSRAATDCKRLQADLSAVTKSNRARADELGAWWDGLSSGKREKLNEKYKRYRLPMAMMKASSCRDAVTAGLAGK